jgi:hypothetical protein
MDYVKIEELFVDYILNKLGPNSETENIRSEVLEKITTIINDILQKDMVDYITYVIPYGSYPVKTYLNDADIDITICFKSKKSNKMIIDIPIKTIDATMSKLKEEMENKNKDLEKDLITDIKIIMADIRLLKCNIDNINIDVTINNFAGLYKIIFINSIEEQIKHKDKILQSYKDTSYSDNKGNLFRRTFLLIKAWFFYEGHLMGSNVGLMATYTLEILVIYIFNFYFYEINNEFEGFVKFFEIISEFDWDNKIISLYGAFSKYDFYKKLEDYNKFIQEEEEKGKKNVVNEPFWYLDENKEQSTIKENSDKKEPLFYINDIKRFVFYLNKGMEISYLYKEGNIISKNNFTKEINVLDPLNNHNNLGKSISFHSKSRIKSVMLYTRKKLNNILEMRKSPNPFIYMNSLLNLFVETVKTFDLELFEKYLKVPRLIANSKIYKKFNKSKDNNKIRVEKENINKFNSFFSENCETFDEDLIYEEEDFDKYEEDKEKSDINEEEDEDEYEKSSNVSDDINEIEESKENIKDENMIDITEKINNEFILNKENLKILFDLYENKKNSINSNNGFKKKSKEYSEWIEKFLKEHNLI